MGQGANSLVRYFVSGLSGSLNMFYSELTMLSYIISQNDQIFRKYTIFLLAYLREGEGGGIPSRRPSLEEKAT